MISDRDTLDVLKDILKNQEIQLQRQGEALELQRQQFAMYKAQFDRAEKLQDRAEQVQEISARMVGSAKKALFIILPVIIVLIAYLTWLIFQ